MFVEPFEIHISDSVLEDLNERITRTRWPRSVPNSGWEYGTDVTTLQSLVDYCKKNTIGARKKARSINSLSFA